MSRPRFTKTELDFSIKKGDLIQIVTQKIVGVGILNRLCEYTMTVDPPPEPEEDKPLRKPSEISADEENSPVLDLPATVIVALKDIDLIFKLKK